MAWDPTTQQTFVCLQDVLKTSSEDVWVRRIYLSWWRRLEDVLKKSSEDEDKRRLQDVFKTSWWRWMFAGIAIIVSFKPKSSKQIEQQLFFTVRSARVQSVNFDKNNPVVRDCWYFTLRLFLRNIPCEDSAFSLIFIAAIHPIFSLFSFLHNTDEHFSFKESFCL